MVSATHPEWAQMSSAVEAVIALLLQSEAGNDETEQASARNSSADGTAAAAALASRCTGGACSARARLGASG